MRQSSPRNRFARAVQRPLGGHAATRGEDRAEHVDGHRAPERQQQAERRDGRGADRGPATLLDEHRRALPGDAPLAGGRAQHGEIPGVAQCDEQPQQGDQPRDDPDKRSHAPQTATAGGGPA